MIMTTMASRAEFQQTLARLEELLIFAQTPRAIHIELTRADCIALIDEADVFFACGLDRQYPTIGAALVLMVEAIRGK